jgi:hypothetical protein
VRAQNDPLHPEQHCTCPGGPLWATLLTADLGTQFKLAEAQRIYRNLLTPGEIAYYNWATAKYLRVPAQVFRVAVIEYYRIKDEP